MIGPHRRIDHHELGVAKIPLLVSRQPPLGNGMPVELGDGVVQRRSIGQVGDRDVRTSEGEKPCGADTPAVAAPSPSPSRDDSTNRPPASRRATVGAVQGWQRGWS